jgi:hypothetical protein
MRYYAIFYSAQMHHTFYCDINIQTLSALFYHCVLWGLRGCVGTTDLGSSNI